MGLGDKIGGFIDENKSKLGLGAAGMVLGPVGGAVGALIGNGQDINRNNGFINPKRAAKEMLARDYGMMKNNPSQLGLNKSEIGAQMRDAQSQAAAQTNAAASQMSQAALAGQGFQAGAMQQATRGMGQTAADAGAQAGAQAHEASRKMIERESMRIRGEIENQWGKKRDNEQFWGDIAMKTIPMIQEIATKAATGGATAAV